jgi:cysteine desulfurase/selenocysteine lyase
VRTAPAPGLRLDALRQAFPALDRRVHGKPLIYFDNAATTQKPLAVLEAMERFYRLHNANVHRGVHTLAVEATELYESARATVARFAGLSDARGLIFTRGATEAVNLVAQAFLGPRLGAGERVLVTAMEHHSNLVPWQLLCRARGAELHFVPVDERGALDLEVAERMLDERVRLFAFAQVSNVLGTVNPVRELVALARARGIPTLIDGAQAAAHLAIGFDGLGCDFYVLSAHKMYGPTGIGALLARPERLADMVPWQGGGEMVLEVGFESSLFADPPLRFEAGTPNVAGAVGWAAACEFLGSLPPGAVETHERQLCERLHQALSTVPGLRVLGQAPGKLAIASFAVGGLHPQDLALLLDLEGVAVRSGHHCAQPLHRRFGLASSCRASLALYNTLEEIEVFAAALQRCVARLAQAVA